jgi:hypothetical protein
MDFIGAIDRQYYPIALFAFVIIFVCSIIFIKIFIAISKNEEEKADQLYNKIMSDKKQNSHQPK